MGQIIDGKSIAQSIKLNLASDILKLKEENVICTLAVVLVGNNPSSRIYVDAKKKVCEELGIVSKEYIYDSNLKEEDLIKLIQKLNIDSSINGILVQLPLPNGIDEKNVINSISPIKDVDGFHPVNLGNLLIGNNFISPCTPYGCLELLKSLDINLEGKLCVILGRSNIVGKPMSMLMIKENATVCICHSKTNHLQKITKDADILIVAIGKPHFIKKDMVKDGVVIIDVGINRVAGFKKKICGDVDFEDVKDKASYITPVPGGVGPMTIAMLMKNTITFTKLQNNII